MTETLYHLTEKSSNQKTGPMAVSTSSGSTCPDACPLKAKGCYAKSGPLALHWKNITNGLRGVPWAFFLLQVKKLAPNTLMRHNQAGDLPGDNNVIDAAKLGELVEATKHIKAFTYTHKPVFDHPNAEENKKAIKNANDNGFTVNLSADSIGEADAMFDLNIGPVVTLLPKDWAVRIPTCQTPKGRRIIVCPATYKDDVSCSTCRMCMDRDRQAVIGFPAHGTGAKVVEEVFIRETLGNSISDE